MVEQPRVYLGFVVGLGPGIVAGFGVDGQFDFGITHFFKSAHNALPFLKGDNRILASGKGQNPKRLQGFGFSPARVEVDGFPSPTIGPMAGEGARLMSGRRPGTVASHA